MLTLVAFFMVRGNNIFSLKHLGNTSKTAHTLEIPLKTAHILEILLKTAL